MESPIVLVTAIEAGLGFLLSSAILALVLMRGRKAYHYLFAAFLLICVIWDLGIFVLMLRNEHLQELPIIGRIAITPCILIPALLFHFVNLYVGRPNRWAVICVWTATFVSMLLVVAGVFYQIEGVHSYPWGNVFRVVPSFFDPAVFVFWFGINLWACWLLFKAARRAASRLERRHYRYVLAGVVAITFAVVKALVTMGVNAGPLLPLGMLLNDAFAAVIGVAIIKERLFDITVIVKRGALYSLLTGVVIFVYSFSESLLLTYAGELIGGYSEVTHIVSMGVAIAVLMPPKRRLERSIEQYFARRRLEF
jgi:hypothetical protein